MTRILHSDRRWLAASEANRSAESRIAGIDSRLPVRYCL
jgi:hypothetical protein